jgi:predicted DNA-binding ribbon-helix-helix protein
MPTQPKPPRPCRAPVRPRTIWIGNRKTTIRFSEELLSALGEIGLRERCDRDEICAMVARTKPKDVTLTRALNLFVLRYFRDACTEEGHLAVGHGSIYPARGIVQ